MADFGKDLGRMTRTDRNMSHMFRSLMGTAEKWRVFTDDEDREVIEFTYDKVIVRYANNGKYWRKYLEERVFDE